MYLIVPDSGSNVPCWAGGLPGFLKIKVYINLIFFPIPINQSGFPMPLPHILNILPKSLNIKGNGILLPFFHVIFPSPFPNLIYFPYRLYKVPLNQSITLVQLFVSFHHRLEWSRGSAKHRNNAFNRAINGTSRLLFPTYNSPDNTLKGILNIFRQMRTRSIGRSKQERSSFWWSGKRRLSLSMYKAYNKT